MKSEDSGIFGLKHLKISTRDLRFIKKTLWTLSRTFQAVDMVNYTDGLQRLNQLSTPKKNYAWPSFIIVNTFLK